MPQREALLRGRGIRTRVARFTLVLLLSLVIGYVAVFFVTLQISANFNQMFRQSLQLEDLSKTLDSFEKHLESYLDTKDSDSFVAYLKESEQLETFRNSFGGDLSYREEQLLSHNIGNILDEYLNQASQAIDAKRARNTSRYIESFNRVHQLSGYINQIIERIRALEFKGNIQDYLLLSARINEVKVVFLLMTVVFVALSIVFILDFTRKLIAPIEKLSQYAGEISRGNYEVHIETVRSYREADLLSSTFSDMARSIRDAINALMEHAQMEGRLRDAEIDKLRMQNQLRQAELMALQSQINPHFLFNTLNAGMQLAYLEDAEKTGEFMDCLARMFRYNIQSLSNTVILKDESDNVSNYYRLMKVRFDDMIQFNIHMEPETLSVTMPPLVLQPLIENAMIHGFRDREEVGIIDIVSERIPEGIQVTVKDNGRGISPAKVEEMNRMQFQKNSMTHEQEGHTTGLGLANVYERLKRFYGREDVLWVESEEGQSTTMILKLYWHTEAVHDTAAGGR